MKKWTNVLVTALVAQTVLASASMESGFENPPAKYWPGVFWEWCNGSINKASITSDLEAMKRVGINGGKVFNTSGPEGPVRFASEEWFEMMAFACEEAERLDMDIGLNITEGFNCAGGPWITPDRSMQQLTWSETEVSGPGLVTVKLARPKPIYNAEINKHFPPTGMKEEAFEWYEDVKTYAVPATAKGRIVHYREKSGLPNHHGFHLKEVLTPTPEIPAADIVNPAQVIELTDKVDADGNLNWNAAAGTWTILRMGRMTTATFTRPGNWATTGLDVDKLSRENVQFHLDHLVKPLLEMKNVTAGKNLKFLGVDSWEAGDQNWSVVMPAEFEERRGYSLYPWLPVLAGRVVGSVEESERFLWDYRRTIADCIRVNFFGYLTELSDQLGMKFEAENFTRSYFDGPEVAEVVSKPCATFWHSPGNASWGKWWNSKWASSAAHVSGAEVTTAEAFPAARRNNESAWVNHPWNFKQRADNQICSGVNHFLFHCNALQPWADKKNAVHKPGMIFKFWGSQYSQHNTWWDLSRDWHAYLSRCFYMLRQGTFSASVAFMTPEEIPGDEQVVGKSANAGNGHDWDLCSSRSVKEKMVVKDGEFRLPSGMRYRLLVLPKMERITPELLTKLKGFLEAGGNILVSSKPTSSCGLRGYPQSNQQVQSLVAELWQDLDGETVKEQAYGKGNLYWGVRTGDILNKLKVEPDLTYATHQPKKWYQYIRRYTDDADIYFICANNDQTPSGLFSFKGTEKVPELWYPDAGRIEECVVYTTKNGRTQIPLLFDTHGSVFVVVRDATKTPSATSASINGRPILSTETALPAPTYSSFGKSGDISLAMSDGSTVTESFEARPAQALDTNWTVTFPKDSELDQPVLFRTLTPWNEHADERIRYFSGTASYTREFECDPDGNEIWFELGKVEVISELFINGKKAQILWKPPYRANITGLVKRGKNKVEVHVANLWPNRLIGDERFPRDFETRGGFNHQLPQWLIDDKPRPESRRKTFSTFSYYQKDDPLLPSGLIGPVQLLYTPKLKNPQLQQVCNFVARHAVHGEPEPASVTHQTETKKSAPLPKGKEFVFQNSTGDFLWNQPANWVEGKKGTTPSITIPAANDDLFFMAPFVIKGVAAKCGTVEIGFHTPGKGTIAADGSLTARVFTVGFADGKKHQFTNDGTLTLSGNFQVRTGDTVVSNTGTLRAESFLLGIKPNATSSVFVNTGTMELSKDFMLSWSGKHSVFHMKGGSVSAKTLAGGSHGKGLLKLHGGTMKFDRIAFPGTEGYRIDIKGEGRLLVSGDAREILNAMMAKGLVTGEPGLNAVYDANAKTTTLTNR